MCRGGLCCLVGVVVAVLAFGAYSGVQSAQAPAQEAAPVQHHTFVVIYERGPAWDASKPAIEQANIQGHMQFIRANFEKMLAAGPFLEALPAGGSDRVVGMVIVRATSAEEAQALLAGDPALTTNLMQVKVRNWQVERVKGF